MKTSSELRAAAWKTSREGRWVMKFMLVQMVFVLVFLPVQHGWQRAVSAMDIQTWGVFLQAKAKALLSGMDLAVPSRVIAWRMTEATAFEMFFSCVVQGLFMFALVSLFLRAAKGDSSRWFLRSFEGFKYPLGVAGLYFRYMLQVSLWSLLFVVPGVVATYRYKQCWNLKVEHPEWSAGKCLSESARMMDGHKWRCFCFECSYWRPVTLLLLGIFVLAVLVETGLLSSPVVSAVSTLTLVCCMWGAFVLAAYMSIGQALFYLEIKVPTSAQDLATTATE